MTENTTPDRRALTERPTPVATLPHPWQEVHLPNDPARAAALAAAQRAGSDFAARSAAQAADMLRRVLPGAASAVFERDHSAQCECPEHLLDLRLVRDHHGNVLWHDGEAFSSHPDVVRRDESEAYGGPVLPDLDTDTREAIQSLAAAAQQWASPLAATDETFPGVQDGEPIELHYDGDLYALVVDEAIAAVDRLNAAAPSSIDLDRLAAVLRRETSVIAEEDVDGLMAVIRDEAAGLWSDGQHDHPGDGATTGA